MFDADRNTDSKPVANSNSPANACFYSDVQALSCCYANASPIADANPDAGGWLYGRN